MNFTHTPSGPSPHQAVHHWLRMITRLLRQMRASRREHHRLAQDLAALRARHRARPQRLLSAPSAPPREPQI